MVGTARQPRIVQSAEIQRINITISVAMKAVVLYATGNGLLGAQAARAVGMAEGPCLLPRPTALGGPFCLALQYAVCSD